MKSLIRKLIIWAAPDAFEYKNNKSRMESITPFWQLGSDQPYYDVCEEIHKLRTYTGLDEYEHTAMSGHRYSSEEQQLP